MQDLYVNEHNSQSEVVISWRREQERRNKMNIDAGLKILGAGLRHIRTDRGQTLMEIAERADMTLSVYHRIEMGQREVSEREFKNIAKAFSYDTVDELKDAVDALDKEGKLNEIMERTDTKFKLLSTPKGGTVSMYGVPTNEALKIKIFGTPAKDGNIIINKEDKDAKEIARPANLLYKRESYGLNLCTRRLGNLLPTRAILFADPQDVVSIGDIAVYYVDDVTVMLLSIREDENGQLYGMRWNPDEKIMLTDDDLSKMHKVVAINL